MILNDAQLAVIREHTLSVYPNEAVVAITEDGAIPMDNTHPEPRDNFKVDTRDFYRLKGIALVHSHPVILGKPRAEFAGIYADVRIPSKMDMQSQMAMNIPFGIVSCDGLEVSPILWFPDIDSAIIEKPYISGVYDCFRVIRAYYWQNYKIFLKDIPRNYKWWEDDPDMFTHNFKDYGFNEVSEPELQAGDVLLIRISGEHESHSGVYIGNDQFVHHLSDQMSKIDNYSRWRKRVTRILRHRDKPCINRTN